MEYTDAARPTILSHPLPFTAHRSGKLVQKYADCKKINRRTERATAFMQWEKEMLSYIKCYNL
jgi:hypothetical protein